MHLECPCYKDEYLTEVNFLYFFTTPLHVQTKLQTIISLPEMCERLKAKDDIKRISTANKYLRSTNQVSNLETLRHGGLLIFCTFLWSLFLDFSQKSMTSKSELKTWEYSIFDLVQCFQMQLKLGHIFLLQWHMSVDCLPKTHCTNIFVIYFCWQKIYRVL